MANRIERMLEQAKRANKKILCPYITAADPQPDFTMPLMLEMARAGADMLELGIPFSDPMAEGPVIQAAMERSLAYGTTISNILRMVTEFRQLDDATPIILMGYVNPIEVFGYESFAKEAHQAGVDGLILVDLPPEETIHIQSIWDKQDLYPIYLCSPTTSSQRLQLLNEYGRGYFYYVSLKGVTGAQALDVKQVQRDYEQKKSLLKLPLLVGFGIKTAQNAAQIARFADGVILGAALIEKIYSAYLAKQDVLQEASAFIKEIRVAIDQIETQV